MPKDTKQPQLKTRAPRKKLALRKDTIKDLGPGHRDEAAIKGGGSGTSRRCVGVPTC
jgi:hypothetical protein